MDSGISKFRRWVKEVVSRKNINKRELRYQKRIRSKEEGKIKTMG